MRHFITAAAISVTLFAAGCSSDSEPASQATTPTTTTPTTTTPFDGGLLTNAGFDTAGDGWIGNAFNIQDDGTGSNAANFADVGAAGNAFDVNLSQVVAIEQGKTYTLMFKGKSDVNRTILAGIGLNEDPWTNNSETVNLTTEWQTFTLTLPASNFGSANSRVLFDMGAEIGQVLIDDVSLVEAESTAPALSQIDLPVSFDDATIDYAVTDFGGASSTLVADPADAENMVVRTVKADNAETWAGTTIGNVDNAAADQGFDSVIPFTATETTMSVRVYSADAGTPVRLKVERADDNTVTAETETLTTVANEWETMVFDLNNVASGTAAFDSAAGYDKASIFFNFGVDGATAGEQTYLWDDVAFGGTAAPSGVTLLDFEQAASSYTIGEFGGAGFVIEADPVDASNNALKMTRALGTEWWSGGLVDLATPEDATSGAYTMDVYSTSALAYVELKLEQDGDNHTVMTTTHGGTGWETMSFDVASGTVTGEPSAATKAVFTPRVTSDGSHTQTADEVYYIDNIVSDSSDATPPAAVTVALPLDFELAANSYTINEFGGAGFVIEADPVDASNNALKMTRALGTEWWSGGLVDLTTPVDATAAAYTMDVYSTSALAYVELKFEQDADNHTIMTTTHGGSGWETLSFDSGSGTVTGAPSAATKAVFTPRVTSDGTHTQTADEIYYIDNIMM